MCRPENAQNLGKWLGSKDPAHIARWIAAQQAGRRTAPRCQAISKSTGQSCRNICRRGQTFCLRHGRGNAAVSADASKEIDNAKVLASGSGGVERARAVRSMQRIARHRFYRLWRLDPRGPEIDLLELSPGDEQRVAAWLWDNHTIALDKPLPGTDRPATARCRDRLRQAAFRVLRRGSAVSQDFLTAAHRRVTLALRDDAKFWRKWEALGADPE